MKQSFFLFILLFISAGFTYGQTTLSPLEQGVLDELNRVRTDPVGYAKWMEESGKNLPYRSEEPKAIPEAIKALKSTSPLPAFKFSDGLSNASRAQVKDQLPTGDFNHGNIDKRVRRFGTLGGGVGENYTILEGNAKSMVLSWIIDDGIPDRGHRWNILSKRFNFIGIACGEYSKPSKFEGQSLCVTTFAQQFK